jgi:ribosomal protein S8
MQITDSIADMITRIRNAGSARHEFVDIPSPTEITRSLIKRWGWYRRFLTKKF